MSSFYLKLLSGNHLGAEVLLSPGRYSFGRGELCDLVLSDSCLKLTELAIDISNKNNLKIIPKKNNIIYLNGSVQKTSFVIQSFDVITTSNVHFTLGVVGENWPDIQLPNIEVINKQSVEESEELLEVNQKVKSESMEKDILLNQNNFLTDTTKTIHKSKKWFFSIIFVFFLLLATVSVFLVLNVSDENVSVSQLDDKSLGYVEKGQIILSKLQMDNVRLEMEDGGLLLKGYIKSDSHRQMIQNAFFKADVSYVDQLINTNNLLNNAKNILKTNGYYNLDLEPDNTPGSLIMTGYIASLDELNTLIELLKQKVYGLISIHDQVDNQKTRLNLLKSILRERKLITQVYLSEKVNQITLEARFIDDNLLYELGKVVDLYRNKYGKQPELKLISQQKENKKGNVVNTTAVSFEVKSVSLGLVPYVVLQDGIKYLIGSEILNGYFIKEIHIDYLLLNKGSKEIKYPLGEN